MKIFFTIIAILLIGCAQSGNRSAHNSNMQVKFFDPQKDVTKQNVVELLGMPIIKWVLKNGHERWIYVTATLDLGVVLDEVVNGDGKNNNSTAGTESYSQDIYEFDTNGLLVDLQSIKMKDKNTPFKSFKNYVKRYGNKNYDLNNLVVTDVKDYSLFGQEGKLVCMQDAKGENIFYYPGPYGILLVGNKTYDSGGGSYLCTLESIDQEGSREYYLMRKAAALYPEEDFNAGIEGSVTVEYTISEQGKVEDAHIYSPGPTEAMNQAALESIKKYVYGARIINNLAYKVHGVKTRISFSLPDSDVKPGITSIRKIEKRQLSEKNKKGIEKIISKKSLHYYHSIYVKEKHNKAMAQSSSGAMASDVSGKSKKGVMNSALLKCQKLNQSYEKDFPCKIINVNDIWVD